MSLNWNTKNVENHDEVCFITATEDWPHDGTKKGDRLLNPVTSALIWHSLSTGIGTITAENASEVWARISFVETLYGASLHNADGPLPITKQDVLNHVGLYTNASFKIESRASFLKRHAASFLDDAKRSYERDAEKATA